LFDIEIKKHDYERKAFVVHVETESDHLDTAWQRFLRDGPIALLPLGKNEASIVWSTTTQQIELIKNLTNDSLNRLLSEATDHVLGNLKVISEYASFDLKYQHAKTYTKDNFVVIGDAAHCIHPLAGQGLNLGIADASYLVDVMNTTLRKHEYIGDRYSLRVFERERKSANWMMLNFVDMLHKLFLNSSNIIENLRGFGMRLFNRNSFIKRYAMKKALGIDI
jgi:2-octaprenylphenol hydroxylase